MISDNGPKILDLPFRQCQNFWDTATNLPTMPSRLQTNGVGCAVVVNNYVYLFANSIVRRFYLSGLGPGNTDLPQPDGKRVWENLGSIPLNSVYSSDCTPIPTNHNQIWIEVAPTTPSTPNSIIYVIPTNTLAIVASTTATVDFNSGTPLNKLCHGELTPSHSLMEPELRSLSAQELLKLLSGLMCPLLGPLLVHATTQL
jgi:hypothetical protein